MRFPTAVRMLAFVLRGGRAIAGAVDPGPGRRRRAAQLSVRPRFRRADQRRGGRYQTGAHRVSAARGRRGAGQSRHAKQRFRAVVADAGRDSLHVRAGHRLEQLRNSMGQRGRRVWSPGSRSISACARANVAAAAAAAPQTEAALKRTQFEVAVAAADAYLTLAAAQETVRAAQAGVDRGETVLAHHSGAGERRTAPRRGSLRARKRSWRRRARKWIQAQQATDVARATVSQFVGMEPARIAIAAPGIAAVAARTERRAARILPRIPQRSSRTAVVAQAQAQLRALERSYFPRFYLQGAAYARGTGAETDGRLLGGLNGLAPNVQDYALGFTVSFPVADLPAVQAREAAQSADSARPGGPFAADRDRPARAMEHGRRHRAGARRIAANTPVQVSAARAAAEQATARYKSGPREYRRSGRGAAPAHASRNRRCAGPLGSLARAAGGGHGCRRHPAFRGGGWPVTCAWF